MLRIGIGFAVVIAAYLSFLGWLKKHDAAIYAKARTEIARQIQEDAAEKERAAIEAENEVTPTPESQEGLASLCAADCNCRDNTTCK
jgi:hypothetical protein